MTTTIRVTGNPRKAAAAIRSGANLAASLRANNYSTEYVFETGGKVLPIPSGSLDTAKALAASYAAWQGYQDDGPNECALIAIADVKQVRRVWLWLAPKNYVALDHLWYALHCYAAGAGCPD